MTMAAPAVLLGVPPREVRLDLPLNELPNGDAERLVVLIEEIAVHSSSVLLRFMLAQI